MPRLKRAPRRGRADKHGPAAAEELAETRRTAVRLMVALVVLALVSVLALGQPDVYLLDTGATVSLPSIGATSSRALLVLGPVLLIGLRILLQVYVDHWHRLEGEAAPEFLPSLSPLRHPLLRVATWFVMWLLVPLTLGAYAWKGMGLPATWGYALLVVFVLVSAAHALQAWRRDWATRLYFSLNVTAVIGVIGGGALLDELRRPLDLRFADLARTDLAGMDLRQADLRGALLQRTDLMGTDLRGSNLDQVDLRKANLRGADLSGIPFHVATFGPHGGYAGAQLYEADLRGASLNGARLSGATFIDADLRRAEFVDAQIGRAFFSRANLAGTDLSAVNEATRWRTQSGSTISMPATDLRPFFKGACGDAKTRLPPSLAGVRLPPCEDR